MKGFITFAVLVIAPIIFWIIEPGLALRQSGYGWAPFVAAPVQAVLFAFIVFGLPGKKIVGTDDQGNKFIGGFWGVSALLTIALIVVAFILKAES